MIAVALFLPLLLLGLLLVLDRYEDYMTATTRTPRHADRTGVSRRAGAAGRAARDPG
ncbi:hypothetical protein QFZ82_000746 [Streptomyces sp. V4I23]|uniref:hypothetical protein n=1 Tax=Streptomyces sp. V4I23 TaxID=3042282 RepID=UPI00277E4E8A|nr:hypothetical protein [Streptomyces sp. V4I23]MDQ1006261.1 hypothetical protein [Streptomyces sp. V4I23]